MKHLFIVFMGNLIIPFALLYCYAKPDYAQDGWKPYHQKDYINGGWSPRSGSCESDNCTCEYNKRKCSRKKESSVKKKEEHE